MLGSFFYKRKESTMTQEKLLDVLLAQTDVTYHASGHKLSIEGDLDKLIALAKVADAEKLGYNVSISLRNVPRDVYYQFMIEKFEQYGKNWHVDTVSSSELEKIYDKFSLSYQSYDSRHYIYMTAYRAGTVFIATRGIDLLEDFDFRSVASLMAKTTLVVDYKGISELLKARLTDQERDWQSIINENDTF